MAILYYVRGEKPQQITIQQLENLAEGAMNLSRHCSGPMVEVACMLVESVQYCWLGRTGEELVQ